MLLASGGCASTVSLTQPAPTKAAFPGAATPVSARLADVSGEACFREELTRALAMPGGVQAAGADGAADLSLAGKLSRIEVHSNRGDKEISLLYFSAFVITAPIAAAMYRGKDWHADAAADGELSAVDRSGRTVWTKTLTVSVSETQRTMPTHEALKRAMEAAVCQKLAVSLVNALTDAVARDPSLVGR